jgi:hypothetical protein
MSDEFDGLTTAREERLRRLQAGILPADQSKGGLIKKPGLSPQAAQVLSGVRKSSTPQPTSLPPRRTAGISDKAAELIALVMRDLMRS